MGKAAAYVAAYSLRENQMSESVYLYLKSDAGKDVRAACDDDGNLLTSGTVNIESISISKINPAGTPISGSGTATDTATEVTFGEGIVSKHILVKNEDVFSPVETHYDLLFSIDGVTYMIIPKDGGSLSESWIATKFYIKTPAAGNTAPYSWTVSYDAE